MPYKPRIFEITLEVPNMDIAVEHAVAAAAGASEDDEDEPGTPPTSLAFVGLKVEIRSTFGRENRYTYTFEAR